MIPVRIGRTSSREAARATRSTVSASAAAGIVDRVLPELGQAGEILGVEQAQVEAWRCRR